MFSVHLVLALFFSKGRGTTRTPPRAIVMHSIAWEKKRKINQRDSTITTEITSGDAATRDSQNVKNPQIMKIEETRAKAL